MSLQSLPVDQGKAGDGVFFAIICPISAAFTFMLGPYVTALWHKRKRRVRARAGIFFFGGADSRAEGVGPALFGGWCCSSGVTRLSKDTDHVSAIG